MRNILLTKVQGNKLKGMKEHMNNLARMEYQKEMNIEYT